MFIAGAGFYIKSSSGELAMVTTGASLDSSSRAALLERRLGLTSASLAGIYLFAAFYGPGAGPVPFTYSAEVYPLQVREIGMAWATSVTWFFNFINALVFPLQLRKWTSFGAFAWFGGWNAILWVLVLCFCPETKGFVRPSLSLPLSLAPLASRSRRRREADELLLFCRRSRSSTTSSR